MTPITPAARDCAEKIAELPTENHGMGDCFCLDQAAALIQELVTAETKKAVEERDALRKEGQAELEGLYQWVKSGEYNRDDAPDEIARAIRNRITTRSAQQAYAKQGET